jgi:formate dehydrogenase subunit gamma
MRQANGHGANMSWHADLALQRVRGHLQLEGPLLPILHALHDESGSIDESAEPMITRAKVHGFVTFYHDFRRAPAGRPVLSRRIEPLVVAAE